MVMSGPPKALTLDQARYLYEVLRDANPWLPDGNHVLADEGLTVSGGPGQYTALTLTLLVEIPATWLAP